MRIRDFDHSRSPAELFAAHVKPTSAATGEPAGRHAEADPAQLHRHPGLRPGDHDPVQYARPRLPERVQQRLGERGRAFETHHGERGRRAPGRRAQQTGSHHLHRHVPTAVSAGAADCVLHQLPAPELVFRLHAI